MNIAPHNIDLNLFANWEPHHQEEYIDQHRGAVSGNFQGIALQIAMHSPDDHAAITNHLEAVAQHYDAAMAAQPHDMETFNHRIHQALLSLQPASERLHHYQQQPAVGAAVGLMAPPHNNAGNNQILEEDNAVHPFVAPEEEGEQPHAAAVHNNNVVNHHVINDGGDETDSTHDSDYSEPSHDTDTTQDILNAPAHGAGHHAPQIGAHAAPLAGVHNHHEEPDAEAEEINDDNAVANPANNNAPLEEEHNAIVENDLVVEDLE